MRTTLILFIFIALFFSGITASAQQFGMPQQHISFQIKGGANYSNLTADFEGDTDNAKAKLGFVTAAIAELPIDRNLYIQTGIMFLSKGAKVKAIPAETGNIDGTMNALYLQLPIYFAYKVGMPYTYNSFNFALGPYFGYGVAGKTSYTYSDSNTGASTDTFLKNGLWNRADMGMGMEIQFEMQYLVLAFGAQLSLTRAWKREMLLEKVNVRNNTVYLAAGFKF